MSWLEGRRILVPYDFSEAALDAIRVADSLAGNRDDVQVLNVLVDLPATDPIAIWDDEAEEKRKQRTLESLAEKMTAAGLENVSCHVGVGDAGSYISRYAEEHDVGLIVIPSHGYTGLQRVLLGSVAEKVVRHAKCPVLVLKEKP